MKSAKTYRHLRLEERQYLELQLATGKSKRQIAKELGRSHSTICRELKRNEHPLPGVSREMTALERAKDRDERADKRWRRSKKRDRLKDRELRAHVLEKLIDDEWSPEQIAGSLQEHLPGRSITTKTIYNFVKYERPSLRAYLRRRGKSYRQRVANRRSSLRQPAPEKRSISERPVEVNERIEYGHWEGDTVVSGRSGSGAVLTVRERKSRKRYYFLIADLKANTVRAVLMVFFQLLPLHMRKTLTLDNGSEFAPSEMHKLERVCEDFKVYYCHPFCACERGAVENANGELRWYYPKGTDFSKLTQDELSRVEEKINHRPMRVLEYQSATSIFEQASGIIS